MDFFESPNYRLNKRLLFCLGQWPLQSRNERNFYRTTTGLIVGSIIVPELIKFMECLGDLKGMTECLPLLGIHIRSVVKLINSSVKATTMRKLTNRIKDDWTVRINEYDVTILRSFAERGKLLTMIYFVYVFTGMMLFLILPLIPLILDAVVPLNQTRDRVYLLQSEYFVDQDEKYFYILIHACISLPLAITVMVACDSMYVVYVHHACGIFTALGARLQNIASNDKTAIDGDPDKKSDKTYNEIVDCIKMHNEAVKISQLIESSHCVSLLFVVGASVLTITVTGFMTVTNLDQPNAVLRYGIVAIGDLMHLFFMCWQGQVLMEYSGNIFMNAYNVDWYDLSPRAKKLLLLIMQRSYKPCKLTAGKVFVFSMENYAVALKSAMSYFTVLLSRQ